MTDPCGATTCGDMIGTTHTTNYVYADSPAGGNPAGNSNAYLTKIISPTTTNGIAHQSSFSYNYADGQVLTATDENNRTTTYKYNTPPSGCTTPDGLDRLSEIGYPDNGKTTYCYNDSVPSITTSQLLSTSPSMLWKTSTSVMDGLGHVVQTQLVSDPAGTDYVDTTYDGEGHVASVSNAYRSADPSHGSTLYSYDAVGRKTQVKTLPDGNYSHWIYAGNTVTSTIRAGITLNTPTMRWAD
jgi:hypothetical protein